MTTPFAMFCADDKTKETIRKAIMKTGAVAVGFARAGAIDTNVDKEFSHWLDVGNAAGMDFLRRHKLLRRHTDNVLPGSKTVICAAFPSEKAQYRNKSLPWISPYAYGSDYHKRLHCLLKPVARMITSDFGEQTRICIDSAPVAERYWARISGVGAPSLNGCVSVAEFGQEIMLAEILTTLSLPPDPSAKPECNQCGACITACPGQALNGDGTLDARKCISYITIEHHGSFTKKQKSIIERGHPAGHLFGCDICRLVCPLNNHSQKNIVSNTDEVLLTADDAVTMTHEEFNRLFQGSAVKRCRFEGFHRNALAIVTPTVDAPGK